MEILLGQIAENAFEVPVGAQVVGITSNEFLSCVLGDAVFETLCHLGISGRQVRQGIRVGGR